MIVFLYLYPLMGLIHVLGAIIRLGFGKNRYPGYKNKLAKYLLIVGIYFLVIVLFEKVDLVGNHLNNSMGLAYLFGLPWIIAGYYWHIIYKEEKKEMEESEPRIDPLTSNLI